MTATFFFLIETYVYYGAFYRAPNFKNLSVPSDFS